MTSIQRKLEDETIRYSQVWEDERLLSLGLELGSSDRVLSIGSAGCNVLNMLLAGEPEHIVAVDVNPAQVALVELKLAAIRQFEHEDFLLLLGYSDDAVPGRRLELLDALELPAKVRSFWSAHRQLVEGGLAWCGRLDTYFASFAVGLPPLWAGRELVSRLFSATNLEEQIACWEDMCDDSTNFKSSFVEYYGRQGQASHGRSSEQLTHVEVDLDLGLVVWRRLDALVRRERAAQNFYLRRFLQPSSELDASAPYLLKSNFSHLKRLVPRVEVRTGLLQDMTSSFPPSYFSKVNCSDLFEYLDQGTTNALLGQLAGALAPGGRIAFWELYNDRSPVVPALSLLPVLSDRLAASDRCFQYGAFRVLEVGGNLASPPPSPPPSPPEAPAEELMLLSRGKKTDEQLVAVIGGKALNLFRLTEILTAKPAGGKAPTSTSEVDVEMGSGKGKSDPLTARVPPFFAVTTAAFHRFLVHNDLIPAIRIPPGTVDIAAHAEKVHDLVVAGSMPPDVEQALRTAHSSLFSPDSWLAVRSSGTDEDSSDNSFAGQYESYLFQRGEAMVLDSLKRCWASAFSERVFASRLRAGLVPEASRMGVVVQYMINSDTSGVAFSRHPLTPASTPSALVSAVMGVGEGLVSGALDSDAYTVSRDAARRQGRGWKSSGGKDVEKDIVDKDEKFVFDAQAGSGLERKPVPEALRKEPALTNDQAIAVARMTLTAEDALGCPQDTEWAFEQGQLYVVQARPIPTLPGARFFERHVDPKRDAMLWDNSNIVESYSG